MTAQAARNRAKAYRKGRGAEIAAALFLLLKGYRIIGRRYRTPVGEIDLIVRRGRGIAFVEVKARGRLDNAALAITAKQKRRLIRAAQYWLMRFPSHNDHAMTFDAILIAPWTWPRHLKDAFRV